MTRTLMLSLALVFACGDKDGDDTASSESDTDTDTDTDTDVAAESDVDTDTDTDTDTDVTAGETVYMATCGSDYCHGGDGVSGSAPDHPAVVPALSDEALETIIQGGQGYMPGQNLSDQELDDVIAYLRATFP